jgi:hypothetical protein
MAMALGDVFGARLVERLAGERVHARGVRYFEDGRVVHEGGGDARVRAIVKGTVPYAVELSLDDGQPAWSCTCPAAEEGAFCKHCVAVALTLGPQPGERPRLRVVSNDDESDGDGDRNGAGKSDGDIERYVTGLPQETLARIVLGQARMDRRLYKRLAVEAETSRARA